MAECNSICALFDVTQYVRWAQVFDGVRSTLGKWNKVIERKSFSSGPSFADVTFHAMAFQQVIQINFGYYVTVFRGSPFSFSEGLQQMPSDRIGFGPFSAIGSHLFWIGLSPLAVLMQDRFFMPHVIRLAMSFFLLWCRIVMNAVVTPGLKTMWMIFEATESIQRFHLSTFAAFFHRLILFQMGGGFNRTGW